MFKIGYHKGLNLQWKYTWFGELTDLIIIVKGYLISLFYKFKCQVVSNASVVVFFQVSLFNLLEDLLEVNQNQKYKSLSQNLQD